MFVGREAVLIDRGDCVESATSAIRLDFVRFGEMIGTARVCVSMVRIAGGVCVDDVDDDEPTEWVCLALDWSNPSFWFKDDTKFVANSFRISRVSLPFSERSCLLLAVSLSVSAGVICFDLSFVGVTNWEGKDGSL